MQNSLITVLGSDRATVGMWGTPQGSSRIQGRWLQLQGRSVCGCGSPATGWASYLMILLILALGVCSALWRHLGSRGVWVDLVPGAVPTG